MSFSVAKADCRDRHQAGRIQLFSEGGDVTCEVAKGLFETNTMVKSCLLVSVGI